MDTSSDPTSHFFLHAGLYDEDRCYENRVLLHKLWLKGATFNHDIVVVGLRKGQFWPSYTNHTDLENHGSFKLVNEKDGWKRGGNGRATLAEYLTSVLDIV